MKGKDDAGLLHSCLLQLSFKADTKGELDPWISSSGSFKMWLSRGFKSGAAAVGFRGRLQGITSLSSPWTTWGHLGSSG